MCKYINIYYKFFFNIKPISCLKTFFFFKFILSLNFLNAKIYVYCGNYWKRFYNHKLNCGFNLKSFFYYKKLSIYKKKKLKKIT